MEMKTLPNDLRCEQEILEAMFNNKNSLMKVIDEVEAEDFYKTAHQLLFSTICKMYSEGKELELTLIIDELGKENIEKIGGITYLTEIISNGITSNIEQYIKILKDKSYRRKSIKALTRALEDMYDERNNPYEISELTTNKLTEKVENKSSVKTDRELMEETLVKIEKRVNQGGDTPGMQTGIKDLDKATGGFEKGELNIIAARPSMGKTVTVLNLLDGLSQNGYKVFLAELEMTEEALGIRRLANNATVEANRMKFGNMQQEDFNKILQAASILGNRNNIFTDCTSNQSLLNIKSKAKAIKQSHGLDVVIIDHLTIMNIPNRQTRDVAIGEITKGLKSLAKDLEISVILLCQLSRAPEQRADHRPMLSDLRESGNIEQDADTVIMLYRDEYYNKETEDKNIMECIITKQRNGATGTVKLFYSSDYQRICDLDIVH